MIILCTRKSEKGLLNAAHESFVIVCTKSVQISKTWCLTEFSPFELDFVGTLLPPKIVPPPRKTCWDVIEYGSLRV